jgi:putative lipoprotein
VKPQTIGAALFVALYSFAPGAFAVDRDPWFGPDKPLHFELSVALAAGGYAASALVLDHPWQRTIAGGAFSLTLGAGKELYDWTGHGDASWRDFTWDVAGTAVGLGLALLVDAALSAGSGSSHKDPTATRMTGMSLRF